LEPWNPGTLKPEPGLFSGGLMMGGNFVKYFLICHNSIFIAYFCFYITKNMNFNTYANLWWWQKEIILSATGHVV